MKYVFLFLLIIPSISALTCDDFEEDKLEECEYIIDNELDEELLEQLYEEEEYVEKYTKQEYDSIGLRIISNKFTYKDGENIEVIILPKDTEVEITYNNKIINAENKLNLVANSNSNKIIAKYGKEEHPLLINVIHTGRLLLAWRIFLFALINYSVFSILTKSIKKWPVV